MRPTALPQLVVLLLTLALAHTIGACGDDAAPTPCVTDADCTDGSVCEAEACTDAETAGRPAIDDVEVPAGAFMMGCDEGGSEADCEAAEGPRHEVTTPAYRIDRLEVTATAFAAFLAAIGGNDCSGEECYDPYFGDPPLEETEDDTYLVKSGLGQRPMAEVTWYGADAYCTWRGQHLCSEAEWEKAARGGCELADDCATWAPRYPWGDEEANCDRAHVSDGGFGCGTETTADVGSYPAGASPYGALDMAGNVWEWVADRWHEDYSSADAPNDGSPWVDGAGSLRVIRGGGFKSADMFVRTSHRWNGGAGDSIDQRGFRCCSAE